MTDHDNCQPFERRSDQHIVLLTLGAYIADLHNAMREQNFLAIQNEGLRKKVAHMIKDHGMTLFEVAGDIINQVSLASFDDPVQATIAWGIAQAFVNNSVQINCIKTPCGEFVMTVTLPTMVFTAYFFRESYVPDMQREYGLIWDVIEVDKNERGWEVRKEISTIGDDGINFLFSTEVPIADMSDEVFASLEQQMLYSGERRRLELGLVKFDVRNPIHKQIRLEQVMESVRNSKLSNN